MQADIKISPVKIINQQFQFQKERREENFIKKKKNNSKKKRGLQYRLCTCSLS